MVSSEHPDRLDNVTSLRHSDEPYKTVIKMKNSVVKFERLIRSY